MKFTEYLNARKQMQAPQTALVADYDGPQDVKPGVGMTGAVEQSKVASNPYRAPGQGMKLGKGEKGFGDEGDKNMIYEPDTTMPEKIGAGGKPISTWPKVKTQEWVEATRGMSISEFAASLKQSMTENEIPMVTAFKAGPFHPDPTQTMRYVAGLAKTNDNALATLFHEVRKAGCLAKFVAEILKQPESFAEMVKIMEADETGARYAHRFVRALMEEVAPPINDTEDEDEDEEAGPEDDMGEPGDEDDMGEPGGPDDMQGPDPGMEAPPGEDSGMGGGPDMDHDQDMPIPPPPPKRKRRKKSHSHIMNAMHSMGGPDMGMGGGGPMMGGPGAM